MKTTLFLLALLAISPVLAADTVACFNQCANQGYDRSYCVNVCERGGGGGGLTQQPGVPRNPYLDAIPDPAPKQKPALRVEPRCVENCAARGYNYTFCRKQCSY
jgi:hypothetical protein